MVDDNDPLSASRRLDSATKVARVRAAIDAMAACGDAVTVTGLARHARVSRRFIYDHPELRAEIELRAVQSTQRQANAMTAAARVTGASLRADLENSRAQNRRLQQQLRSLENRLSQVEGARLVADDLIPAGTLADPANERLAQRVAELEQQLFEATDELQRTTEELDAARVINRELIQRGNRPDPERPPTRSRPAQRRSHDQRGS